MAARLYGYLNGVRAICGGFISGTVSADEWVGAV